MKIKILFLPWGSSTFYWPGDLREQSYCARYWRYLELFGALLRRNLMRSLGKTVFKHLSCCNQWTFLVEIEESDQDFKMFDLADLWFIRVHSYIYMPIWTDHFLKKEVSLVSTLINIQVSRIGATARISYSLTLNIILILVSILTRGIMHTHYKQ